jgi:hypothetical protein
MAGTVTAYFDGVGVRLSGRHKQSARRRLVEVFECQEAGGAMLTLHSADYGVAFGEGDPVFREVGDFGPDYEWARVALPHWAVRCVRDMVLRHFAFPPDVEKLLDGSVVQAWVEDVPAVGFFRHEENGCGLIRPVLAVVVPDLGAPLFEQGHLKVYDYSPKFDEYGRPVVEVSIDTDSLSYRANPRARLLNHVVTLLGKEAQPDSEVVEAPAPIGGHVPVVGVIPAWYWTLRVRSGHAVEVSSPDHPGEEITLQEGFFVLSHRAPERRRID